MKFVPKSTVDNLPTIKEGILVEKEREIRVNASVFISQLGKRLGLPFYTIATAQYYFQYFFCNYSLKTYSYMVIYVTYMQDIGIVCILVASKSEGTHKRIRQILAMAFLILNPSFKGSDLDVEIVEEHRKKIIQYESQLLQLIQFDFDIIHGHFWMIKWMKELNLPVEMARKSWDFISLCYYNLSCVLYPPSVLAMAAIDSSSGALPRVLKITDASISKCHIDEIVKMCDETKRILSKNSASQVV